MNIENIQKKSGIVGRSDSIAKVLEMVAQVSPVDISVLISGESGTGKEIFAKAIHQNSKRSHESIVTVNCGIKQIITIPIQIQDKASIPLTALPVSLIIIKV